MITEFADCEQLKRGVIIFWRAGVLGVDEIVVEPGLGGALCNKKAVVRVRPQWGKRCY
jgi:hypothetical protein